MNDETPRVRMAPAGVKSILTIGGKGYGPQPLSILKNPTRAEVLGLLAAHGDFLRAIEDVNGDLYVWPGALAMHGDMAAHLDLHPRR